MLICLLSASLVLPPSSRFALRVSPAHLRTSAARFTLSSFFLTHLLPSYHAYRGLWRSTRTPRRIRPFSEQPPFRPVSTPFRLVRFPSCLFMDCGTGIHDLHCAYAVCGALARGCSFLGHPKFRLPTAVSLHSLLALLSCCSVGNFILALAPHTPALDPCLPTHLYCYHHLLSTTIGMDRCCASCSTKYEEEKESGAKYPPGSSLE